MGGYDQLRSKQANLKGGATSNENYDDMVPEGIDPRGSPQCFASISVLGLPRALGKAMGADGFAYPRKHCNPTQGPRVAITTAEPIRKTTCPRCETLQDEKTK